LQRRRRTRDQEQQGTEGRNRANPYNVLTNSLFDCRVHKAYAGKIVEEHYSPAGMAVPLAIKDLRLALAAAEREAVPMPAASVESRDGREKPLIDRLAQPKVC
jgi:hypothetical protein